MPVTNKPSLLHPLYFLRQHLSLAWSLPIQQGRLASELQESTSLHLPSQGLPVCTSTSGVFIWGLERELGFLGSSPQTHITSYELLRLMYREWICFCFKPEPLNAHANTAASCSSQAKQCPTVQYPRRQLQSVKGNLALHP